MEVEVCGGDVLVLVLKVTGVAIETVVFTLAAGLPCVT